MLEPALNPQTNEPPSRAELEALFPEAFGASGPKSSRKRRRQKFVWFLAVESVAVLVMTVSILAGLSLRFSSESWTPVFRVLPVTAAVIAALLPILFYGNARGSRR